MSRGGQRRLLAALLDANVLFSAPLRDTLLRAADKGLFRLHWSDEILEELRRNLVETGRSSEGQAQRLVSTMQAYFPEAAVTGYSHLIPNMRNHAKDRHVLAAAVASSAAVILTLNLRDFPSDVLSPLHLEAQSPDRFLSHLFSIAPDVMVEVLHEQASDLSRPPQNIERVLNKLEESAAEFVGLVRRHLANEAP